MQDPGPADRTASPGTAAAVSAAEDTGWYSFLEDLLARSAEEAQGYRIMHEKAYKHYAKISTRLTIPAIILSTLTGVANFGQSSLEPYLGANAPLFIGALSIVAAIFSTIAKYLRADEKSELNRSAMVQWDKLHRMLVTVLTQPRGRRVEAQEFLLQYREERNRLAEQVPVIPYKIRAWFLQHYGQQYNPGIQRPGILNLSDVPVYRAQSPQDSEPGKGASSAAVSPSAVPAAATSRPAPSPPPRGASPTPIGSRMAAVSSHFLPARAASGSPAGHPAAGSRLAQVLQLARARQEAAQAAQEAQEAQAAQAVQAAQAAVPGIAVRAAETAANAAASAVEKATTRAVTDALGRITRDFQAGGRGGGAGGSGGGISSVRGAAGAAGSAGSAAARQAAPAAGQPLQPLRPPLQPPLAAALMGAAGRAAGNAAQATGRAAGNAAQAAGRAAGNAVEDMAQAAQAAQAASSAAAEAAAALASAAPEAVPSPPGPRGSFAYGSFGDSSPRGASEAVHPSAFLSRASEEDMRDELEALHNTERLSSSSGSLEDAAGERRAGDDEEDYGAGGEGDDEQDAGGVHEV
jgi:hypothetical protein